jgi:superfamily II DNA helicase RecQ
MLHMLAIFQLVADFTAVVVSPLKPLMIDQVAKATASGVKANYIGGDNSMDML